MKLAPPVVLATALLALGCEPSQPEKGRAGDIKVLGGYAYSPVSTEAAAYVSLQNLGRLPDTLVAVSTPFAGTVTVHESQGANAAIRMAMVDPLVIPPGILIEMAPGGMHLMLTDLRMPLPAGKFLPLRLKFARGGEMEVELVIHKYGEAP